ncbi:MAG: VWA domain-containing protein [Deltaproteobacteria bacterium]|nr:VWA domain-containing protein [Deltaproteobacteria bacterium]
MPFYFLQPIFLYGLVAASIPLLIHLLNRRRMRRIRFPAVRFVLLSQRRITRSYRLRHWLILALRTMAIALLVFLLARPIFQSGVGLFAGGSSHTSVVILDNSLSMRWSQDREGFEKAKEAARLLISSMGDGDQAALVPTNATNPLALERTRLKDRREALLQELDGIQLTAGTADFSSALARAYELLQIPAPQKTIWLITDLSLTGWDTFNLSSLEQIDPLIPLKIIRARRDDLAPNVTIREVKLLNQGLAVGLPMRLEAEIINFSDREIQDLAVELKLNDNNKEQRLITLAPKEELKVNFQFKLAKTGGHRGAVTLKKVGVTGNPTVNFVLEPQDKVKVLIVDGDPKTSLVQSETFFLSRSLNPTGEQDSSLFLPTVIVPERLSSASLDSYQAIVLCNLAVIPREVLPRLTEYVRKGGGLVIFLGDRVNKDGYNRLLYDSSAPILPTRLEAKRVLTPAKAESLGKVDTSHPVLEGFSDEILKTSLGSTKVHGYFRTGATKNGTGLLALKNGDPLLMEKQIGKGRVLLFTTSADRDWSDLPFKTAYLPLVQSLVTYVSSDQKGTADTGIVAGSPKTFVLPPAYVGKNMRVVKPDLRQREITIGANGQKATVSFKENNLAGIYQLFVQVPQGSGRVPIPTLYAVNPPFLESRLQEIGSDELQAKVAPIKFEIIKLEALKQGGTKMDLSLPLLLLIMVILATEGWLSQRLHE